MLRLGSLSTMRASWILDGGVLRVVALGMVAPRANRLRLVRADGLVRRLVSRSVRARRILNGRLFGLVALGMVAARADRWRRVPANSTITRRHRFGWRIGPINGRFPFGMLSLGRLFMGWLARLVRLVSATRSVSGLTHRRVFGVVATPTRRRSAVV
jgi:hypothetical protein